MEEIWKDIKIEKNGIVHDYTGLYQVSNKGRVRALNYRRTGKIKVISQGTNRGYYRVQLHKNGERNDFQVQRLVATAFIPNPENKPEVNHINENKLDNRVENLEWTTHEENVNHGTRNNRISQSHKNRFINKEKKVD